MTWDGVRLTEDQRDVHDMVCDWRESLAPITSDADSASLDDVRGGLIDLGIWSIGMPESLGGGEAGLDLRLVALAAVAGHSAALAWASAQAHAAAEVLIGAPEARETLAQIVDGDQAVGVVDLSSAASRVTIGDGRASGTVGRIDPAGPHPALVVLDGENGAWFLEPEAVRVDGVLRRTGFAGAGTTSATVDGAALHLAGADVSGVQSRLRLAGAAIAAGLALDATGLARDYASSRVQFGGPLTAIPAVRRSLDNQRNLAVESLSVAVGDDGLSFDRATGALKSNLDRAIDVAAAAVQSHGGYGYIEEYGVARLLRDAVSLRAATSTV